MREEERGLSDETIGDLVGDDGGRKVIEIGDGLVDGEMRDKASWVEFKRNHGKYCLSRIIFY